jgi:lipopolysaccharide exporter
MRQMASRFRRFPLLSSGSALLNAATLQAPLLLLAAFYDPRTAGLFALGQRVLAAPMSLVGTAIANVYFSAIAGVARNSPERLQPLFVRTSKRLALAGIGPAIIAVLFGPWFCRIAFGTNWSEAGDFLRLSAPMLLVQFVASPLGGTLDVLERQDLHLAREIARQALSLGALVIAKAMAFDAWHAVLLFSIAGTIGNVIYIASTWYALRDVSPSAPAVAPL